MAMAESVRHFALLGPDLVTEVGLFRLRDASSGLYLERFDPETKSWAPGHPTLMAYVNQGEIGADEISPAAAQELLTRLARAS
jgi:hypothetical protein